MKELLEQIAKSLVSNPDDVNVTEIEDDNSLILELRVAEEDMGKVIGKQGRVAKAIRVVMKAAAIKKIKGLLLKYLVKSGTENRSLLFI